MIALPHTPPIPPGPAQKNSVPHQEGNPGGVDAVWPEEAGAPDMPPPFPFPPPLQLWLSGGAPTRVTQTKSQHRAEEAEHSSLGLSSTDGIEPKPSQDAPLAGGQSTDLTRGPSLASMAMGSLPRLGAIAAPFARGQRGLNLLAGSYARRAGTRDGSRQPALAARPGSAWRPCAGSLGVAGRCWGAALAVLGAGRWDLVGAAAHCDAGASVLAPSALASWEIRFNELGPLASNFCFNLTKPPPSSDGISANSDCGIVRDSRAPRPRTAPTAPPILRAV